jgi:nitrite reductase/ring-hydroxylating ferredoxin subunit
MNIPMYIRACGLDELAKDQCRSLNCEGSEYFLVRKGNKIFAYENQCPHLGTSLDFVPNQFLSADKSLIQCAMHGALFTIDTGDCVSGPCAGQQLKQAHVKIDGNDIWLHHEND